ncbi:MAG: hypothetical protein HY002_21960 [Candidatus Rokubacteria bacterium]|nr:hypothetical protein [Candidatus Rokubacteria bacterium]
MSGNVEPGPASARWLLIVQRDELALYRYLSLRFHDLGFVEVIRDRRQGDRRRSDTRVEADRRRADRRQPLAPKEREQWSLFDYRLVRRMESLLAAEARS